MPVNRGRHRIRTFLFRLSRKFDDQVGFFADRPSNRSLEAALQLLVWRDTAAQAVFDTTIAK